MPEPRPFRVKRPDVTLACFDHGGTGSPIVLTHGLGDSHVALAGLADRLSLRHHVIVVDQRGHGRSGDAPWSFAAVVADLDAVIADTGLAHPAVVGHSIGGMVALRWGQAHPEARGVVNIDGWGDGVPRQFVGIPEREVRRFLAQTANGSPPGPLGPVVRAAVLARSAGRRGMARTAEIGPLLHDVDWVAVHASLICPSLAICATASMPRLGRLVLGRRATRIIGAFREGIASDLAAAANANPGLTVVDVAGSHGLHRTHVEEVAAAVDRFLDSTSR
jgi:pimeloyl-ACP methyl ester carboxylesterase